MDHKILRIISGFLLFVLGGMGAVLPLALGIREVASVSGTNIATIDYTGFEMIWGRAETDSQTALPVVAGTLTAWILIVLAALLGLAALFTHEKSLSAGSLALGGLFALVAGILFFCAKPLTGMNDSTGLIDYSYSLGAGFILPAIFGCVGGAQSLFAAACIGR
jgi:hypothetical protein